MWPNKFDYTRAGSVDEALNTISDEGKFLAGGHSLLPVMKLRLDAPEQLVDIGGIDSLRGISANGGLSIGATTTHAEIADSSDVQTICSALASACGQVGDQAVRNFGTIGGNIAHADPASDPPTVLVACGATINIQGADGSRSVGAEDFFVDLFETALDDGELITSVSLPNCSDCQCAYVKFPHPASRYAIVGVAVCLKMDGDTCDAGGCRGRRRDGEGGQMRGRGSGAGRHGAGRCGAECGGRSSESRYQRLAGRRHRLSGSVSPADGGRLPQAGGCRGHWLRAVYRSTQIVGATHRVAPFACRVALRMAACI